CTTLLRSSFAYW
nr:immunoglobulin heavy chain junction region [Mus musculus]NSM09699.1 immunoglobulin heavy chain junction region [Mus musculus]